MAFLAKRRLWITGSLARRLRWRTMLLPGRKAQTHSNALASPPSPPPSPLPSPPPRSRLSPRLPLLPAPLPPPPLPRPPAGSLTSSRPWPAAAPREPRSPKKPVRDGTAPLRPRSSEDGASGLRAGGGGVAATPLRAAPGGAAVALAAHVSSLAAAPAPPGSFSPNWKRRGQPPPKKSRRNGTTTAVTRSSISCRAAKRWLSQTGSRSTCRAFQEPYHQAQNPQAR